MQMVTRVAASRRPPLHYVLLVRLFENVKEHRPALWQGNRLLTVRRAERVSDDVQPRARRRRQIARIEPNDARDAGRLVLSAIASGRLVLPTPGPVNHNTRGSPPERSCTAPTRGHREHPFGGVRPTRRTHRDRTTADTMAGNGRETIPSEREPGLSVAPAPERARRRYRLQRSPRTSLESASTAGTSYRTAEVSRRARVRSLPSGSRRSAAAPIGARLPSGMSRRIETSPARTDVGKHLFPRADRPM